MAKEHSAKWHNDNDAIEHPDGHGASMDPVQIVNVNTALGTGQCDCGFYLSAVSTNEKNVVRMMRNKYRAHIHAVAVVLDAYKDCIG
jgi:hypothetical protein